MTEKQEDRKFKPSRAWRGTVALAIAAAVLVLDIVTKQIVQATLAVTGESVELIPGVLGFEFVANRGAAFGLGQGMGVMFALLAVVVTVGTALYLMRAPMVSKVETLGLAMVVGGAIGNAIDRVVLGYVTDFIATRFIDFPVFNVADIGITVGVAVAFLGFTFLSPANRIDATAELNRRDAERRAARSAKKGR